MKNLIKKLKIVFIHFIIKPIFVLRVKKGLYSYNQKFSPNFFLEENNFHSNDFIKVLGEIEDKELILYEAKLVLENKFQTLGSDLVELGEKINWHQDFKSGRVWQKDFYTQIDSKLSINGSDIKVPWELNRFHQAQWLAKAYVITNDEIYAQKFFELVNNWIDENPFCFGVNWNCAMEVAIRAVNWIFALHIFKNSKYYTSDLANKIFRSIYQHGLFIRNNLEYGRRNGNHYLSDLMGLVWIGGFFCKHNFGKKWLKFAKRELEKEILIQVYPDGVDYEKSTFYQRLVTEIFYLSLIVLKSLNEKISKCFLQRLHKMFEFMASYTIDDEIPNVGDCDDGRVIKFHLNEKISDLRNTLAVGAVLFSDAYLKFKSQKLSVDVLLLFGVNGVNQYNSIFTQTFEEKSKAFPDGGFYVLRNSDFMIFFDVGDIGMNGWGGHGHNDIFSFELAYKGKRFIVDSGTYVYTPDPQMRQRLRSTAAHNTVMVDGKEQAEFLNLFRIKEDLSNPKVEDSSLNGYECDFVFAKHFAYKNLKNPLILGRKIKINHSKPFVSIEDLFFGNSDNEIEIFYHLHPEVKLEQLTDKIYKLSRGNLILTMELPHAMPYALEIENGFYSESYGKLQKNLRFRISLAKQKRELNKFCITFSKVR